MSVFYLYPGALKVGRRYATAACTNHRSSGGAGSARAGPAPVLGALGLVPPPLTGMAAALAFAAAIGLVLLQVGALSLHLSRGEVKIIWLNVVLLALAGLEIRLATIRL
jgi:DoxX-like family